MPEGAGATGLLPRNRRDAHCLPERFRTGAALMPNAAQHLLRGAELRKLIDVPRISFESMMRKRTRTALAMYSGAGNG
jgi:hypothetical protein